MQTPSIASTSVFGVLRLLPALLAVAAMLVLPQASHAQAGSSVPVDQIPLTVQNPPPPNIMLMLDDSGSMAWDFMPDWNYIGHCTGSSRCNPTIDELRSAETNGIYYNPTVRYLPPPTASGGSYPNAGTDSANPMGTAWLDGFNTGAGTTDITSYTGGNGTNNYDYYEKSLPTTIQTTYPSVLGCHPGDSGPTNGQCTHQAPVFTTYPATRTCFLFFCYYQCNSGDTLLADGRTCQHQNGVSSSTYAADTPTCPQGGSYTGSNTCTSQGTYTAQWFVYMARNSSGQLQKYYVGKQALDCTTQLLPSGMSPANCSYALADQQNVANWFSYYRTRILMAKSGLMNAFTDFSPTARFGFGSINGTNDKNLPTPTATFGSRKMAQVQPFGNPSTGGQRTNFWNWLSAINPSGGTPLPAALDAVGQYYSSLQPWTDPNNSQPLACRQSFAILTTDGFWNGTNPNVGDVDSTTGPRITGPNNQNYQYTPIPPYSDGRANTLADVAMKYWVNDLRSDIQNEIAPSTEDPAFWQHMTTFTVGLGFTPTGISPAGTSVGQIFNWAVNGGAPGNFSWPAPSGAGNGSINNIADLAHAAVDGHGGFYSATNPTAFASGIFDALRRVQERVGTGASLAANSTELNTDTTTFQAFYRTGAWIGDLKAYAIQVAGSTGAATIGAMKWQASAQMPAWDQRAIYTCNPCSGSGAQAVAFQYGNLTGSQKAALGVDATAQQQIVDYLRGDESHDVTQPGGLYRPRHDPGGTTNLLGDIVSSQPVFEAGSTPAIWVAANDGMLHGFNANTGAELYAYLPDAVIKAGVADIANTSYGTSALPHQYFNDGELTIANIGTAQAPQMILVGTTGRGPARAVYALDVTDVTHPRFLWEYSGGDIGQMQGKPFIAKTGDNQWSVLIGNGFNSATGTAMLLQFDIASGALTSHATNSSTGNGLAAPTGWIPDLTNGIATTAYAGDLLGNVWCFPLSTPSLCPDSTSASTQLIYQAKGPTGSAQPITGGMLMGQDSHQNIWLFFGTGRYLAQTDLADRSVQSWYGLIAINTNNATSAHVTASSTRANLTQRTITAETAASNTPGDTTLGGRTVTAQSSLNANTAGWYIDLVSPVSGQQGERMVLPNQFRGSLLIGTTRVPVASDPCHPSGAGWVMAIDPFTGTNPAAPFFDINNDGIFDAKDRYGQLPFAGIGFASVPNAPIFVGNTMLISFDDATTSTQNTAGTIGTFGRVSWRELVTQ